MGQKQSKETERGNRSSKGMSSHTAPVTRAEPSVSHHSAVPTATSRPREPLPPPAAPVSVKATAASRGSGDRWSTDSLDKFFQKYKDESEDAILAAGMEKFCEDLGVSPTDFVVLVLAWKFQASEMCRFTREEFVNGCQRLKASDANSLKQRFPDLIEETKKSEKSFKDLYNFTFSFGLDHSTGQRTLPVDMAIALWELVFTYRTPPLLDHWCTFLRENVTHGISRDSWTMFLPFISTIAPDFSNYDESEAWPSLFDDFVEQEMEKNR